jgi:hypothetical protein
MAINSMVSGDFIKGEYSHSHSTITFLSKRSINPIYKSLKRPFIIQAMKNKTMEACKNGIKIKTLKSRA